MGDTQKTDYEEALEAARRMLKPIEPDGSYAVDGFFVDAYAVARALLSSSQGEDVRREALEKAAKAVSDEMVFRSCCCSAITCDVIRALASKETER